MSFLTQDQDIKTVVIRCSKCNKDASECKCPDRNKRMSNFQKSTLENYVSGMIGESLRG